MAAPIEIAALVLRSPGSTARSLWGLLLVAVQAYASCAARGNRRSPITISCASHCARHWPHDEASECHRLSKHRRLFANAYQSSGLVSNRNVFNPAACSLALAATIRGLQAQYSRNALPYTSGCRWSNSHRIRKAAYVIMARLKTTQHSERLIRFSRSCDGIGDRSTTRDVKSAKR